MYVIECFCASGGVCAFMCFRKKNSVCVCMLLLGHACVYVLLNVPRCVCVCFCKYVCMYVCVFVFVNVFQSVCVLGWVSEYVCVQASETSSTRQRSALTTMYFVLPFHTDDHPRDNTRSSMSTRKHKNE